jgi:hypothetical protein
MTNKPQTRSHAYEAPVNCTLVGHRWKPLFVPGEFLCTLCGRLASCPRCGPNLPPRAQVRYCHVHRYHGGEA